MKRGGARRLGGAAAAVAIATLALAFEPARAASAGMHLSAASARAAAERDFLRSVNAKNSANQITADANAYVGAHVSMICVIDQIVRADTIIGQCGKEIEPIDLYVRMPTQHRRIGEKIRVLGVVEQPALWVDAVGHETLYPIIRAVFSDPSTAPQ